MPSDGTIEFRNHGLKWNTPSDVAEIVKEIADCPNLTSLTLTGSSLGVEAAEAIAGSLAGKSALKHLYMHDLFTGRDKYEMPKALELVFGAIIESKAAIETLDMSDNALGPNGMKGVEKFLAAVAPHLKVLVFNNNGLGSLGSEMFSNSLIACTKNANDANNENNPKNEQSLQLVELYCGKNRLECEGAKNIGEVLKCAKSLKVLKMPQNGIQHKGIGDLCEALKNTPLLECLDLNDNIITEKGAQAVANYVKTLDHLSELDLGDCLLRDGGGGHLSVALKSTKAPLTKINIAYNELSGETIKALVNSLGEKSAKCSLFIDGNMIGKRNRTAVLELLESQEHITHDGIDNDESTDEEESGSDDEETKSLTEEFHKMGIS